MTVREIVREYLIANGYQGLAYCEDYDGCGCGLDDLIACGESCHNCKPAYKVEWENCALRSEEEGCLYGLDEILCHGCYSVHKPGD